MFHNLEDWESCEPHDVVVDWDNPWLLKFANSSHYSRFKTALMQLFPGRRPAVIRNSLYYKYVKSTRGDVSDEYIMGACRRAIALIDEIHTHGFIKGKEWEVVPPEQDWQVGPPKWYGPVAYGIDENGLLVHHDGMHRMSIAWAIGIPLPMRIVAHHKLWTPTYNHIVKTGLYDVFPHPEFQGLATVRKNSLTRFAKVLDRVRRIKPSRVIDFGSCHGLWPATASSHFPVTVVELSALYSAMTESWLMAVGAEYGMQTCWRSVTVGSGDVCTAFSVIHHISKTTDELDEFLAMVVKAKAVIMENPNNDDMLWHKAIRDRHPEPWSYVDHQLRQAGFTTPRVLHVDVVHQNRQTICYERG